MSSPTHNGKRFDVYCSADVAAELKQLQRNAPLARRPLIAAAFRQIVRKLQSDPTNLGKPLYRLPILRMQVRTVAIIPLIVDFAVCEDRPVVFIKTGKLMGDPTS